MTSEVRGLGEDGYLRDDSRLLAIGPVFTRRWLEGSLWAFGEDDALAAVRAGLDPVTVRAIGIRMDQLQYEADPASRVGNGYPGDKALALAAVEVFEGAPRPLARKRRRTEPLPPG